MEETNPWLDPDSGKHKNKKSVKPEKVENPEKVVELKNIPSYEPMSEKDESFLKILVEDSLIEEFPKKLEEWVIENIDEQFLKDFAEDVKLVKNNLLTSKRYPTDRTLLLLKYIFLLQKCH